MPSSNLRPALRFAIAASLAAVAACGTIANAQLPAFPGAEGAGAYAKGGRGGDVYHVTNLNSSGAGSLAEGIATVPANGRTIVFDVGGYISIPGGKQLRITSSKVTIAGQTAPGDGVGLKGGTFWVSCDDVIIRHMRFRYGKQTTGGDSVDMDSGSANVVFDHCDFLFGTDENFSTWSPPENLTVQWSTNAWGLESHSCGGLWNANNTTAHHTLWAHNHTRNPKARPGLLDWVNNVTFDWDIGFIMGDSETPADWKANVRGSYFIGLAGNAKSFALEKASLDRNGVPNFSLYMEDALLDGNVNGIVDVSNQGYAIARGSYNTSPTPFPAVGVPVTRDNALTAYKKVVSAVGPLRLGNEPGVNFRDEVSTVLINNLVTQKRHHISSETQTGASSGGMGTLKSAPAPADTDRDGMPDYWEAAVGANPGADDHNNQVPAGAFLPNSPAGYTLLEEYLHFLAIPHASMPRNTSSDPTAIDVDLRRFTSGFANSPVFTVSNVAGGATTQSGPGGAIVRFVPALNYAGRARFDFKVADAEGSQWTQTFAVLVSASGVPRSLYWLGDGGANAWDTTTPNFRRDTTATAFAPGDAVTFDETGSNSPAVSLSGSLLVGAVSVNATKNYTFSGSGALTGTMALVKDGTGKLTISNSGTNAFSGGAVLSDGEIALANANAHASGLGSGKVTLNSGTVRLFDAGLGLPGAGVFPNALEITGTATILAPPRGGMGGDVTGSGTLNLYVPYVRNDTSGNWSAFTGQINVTTDADGGDFRTSNMSGYPLARINLAPKVYMYPTTTPSGGATLDIGELSGAAGSNLRGGPTSGRAITWRVGGLNTDSTFAGSVGDQVAGATTNLTKIGTGTLRLSGTSSHSGATVVSGGALRVDGSLGPSAVTLKAGATLGGIGSIGGPVTAEFTSKLDPGAQPGTAGKLIVGAGLTLQGVTIPFQISSSGVSDQIQLTGGTLTLSGTNILQLQFAGNVLAPGTYDLITGGTGTVGGLSNLQYELPASTRQSYGVLPVPGKLQLSVSGSAASLFWLGTQGGGVWDLTTTENWSGATPGTFYNLDAVTFDDNSTVSTVTLNGTVQPRAWTVTNSVRPYTFTGAGAINGPATLMKSGTNALNIVMANGFTGGAIINGGSVVLTTPAANGSGLGTGPVTLYGATLTMYDAGLATHAGTLANNLVVETTGRLNAAPRCGISGRLTGAGTFTLFSPYVRADITGDWSDFTGRIDVVADADGGDFRFGTNYSYPGFPKAAVALGNKVNAYFNGIVSAGAGTTIEIGEISGVASSTLRGGPTGGRVFTYRIGGRNTNAVFAGTIAEQSSSAVTNYVKTGTGTWTLSGNANYNGLTTVEAGTLLISGNLASQGTMEVRAGARLQLSGGTVGADAVNIAAGATMLGNGTLTGDLNNSGTVTCGLGTLTIQGEVVNDGTMRITSGAALQCAGRFVNNGILDLLTGSQGLPANFENNGIVIDSSSLRMVKITRGGSDVTVSLQSYAGHTYQLQRADSVTSPTWTNVGVTVPGNGAVISLVNSNAGNAQQFYRVVVTP